MSRDSERSERSVALIFAFLVFFLFGAHAMAKKHPPAQPLDINSATAEQLQQVPGIGPKTAGAIVHMREMSGPFRRVDDLLAIRGIGKKKYRMMRPYLTVRPPAPPKKKQ
jgi:competence ComEA-like helix-hairpin-helix protein